MLKNYNEIKTVQDYHDYINVSLFAQNMAWVL